MASRHYAIRVLGRYDGYGNWPFNVAVLVGFDAAGNPIVNDTAAATNGTVQRTYARAQLEKLWLEHSGGTVYLLYPPGHVVPRM